MTPDDKIKLIVEAAPGECYHKDTTFDCLSDGTCTKCGAWLYKNPNPSPNSLDDLVALAAKLCGSPEGYATSIHRSNTTEGWLWFAWVHGKNGVWGCADEGADTPAEALLNALVKAVEGRSK